MRFGSNIGWRSPPSVHQVERRPHERERGRGEEARKAGLVPEQTDDGESAPWPDDPWRLREPGERGGAVDRLLEPTQRVDHAERLGLAPRKDATVGESPDLRAVELAPVSHRGDELPVDVVEQCLEDPALLGGHGPSEVADGLELARLDDHVLDPTFFMSALRLAICITTPMDPVSVPGFA